MPRRKTSQNPNLIEKKTSSALAGFSRTRRWLVGVSGGRDSVALLRLLTDLGFKKLVVCHLDHGLRGAASRGDARFVARLATQQGCEVVVEKANIRALAKTSRLSLEAAGRKARYEFFTRVAHEKKCRTIFLAHHADDRVETFLFNLFRGSGMSGLGAMRADSVQRVDGFGLRVVRPLLSVWRSEIDEFVRAGGIAFREDATNTSLEPARNRMRHQIIPTLEKRFGREIRPAIWRTAEILTAENDFIEGNVTEPENQLSVPELRAMPLALQRRTLRQWLKKANVPNAGFDEIEAVRALIAEPGTVAKVNLPGGRHARRRTKKLFLE